MSGPPHHFIPNLTNAQQNVMRSQFTANPMQTQMPGSLQSPLANQITPQLPVQLPNQMMSQMANNLNPQMNPGGLPGGNQMLGQLGQQYNINVNNQMQQQPPPNALQQMQQNAMGKTAESVVDILSVSVK